MDPADFIIDDETLNTLTDLLQNYRFSDWELTLNDSVLKICCKQVVRKDFLG